MPGPVSDSYDPEFGTREVADDIDGALRAVYDRLTVILGNKPPMNILDLVDAKLDSFIVAGGGLTEREWRLLRFAIERARQSL
jgi:hypothetical protein